MNKNWTILVFALFLANFISASSIGCSIGNCDYQCFVPHTLGDTLTETINIGLEKTLEQILEDEGYPISFPGDQSQIQNWEIKDKIAKLEIKYVDGLSSHDYIFGYYLNGNEAGFIPLFKTANIVGYESVQLVAKWDNFTVYVDDGNDIGFGIIAYDKTNRVGFFATENNLNPEQKDRAVVVDREDEFLVGFESKSDNDYQDVVVKVKRASCQETIEHYCGDKNLDKPNSQGQYEECDDGNNADGDGCSSECEIETCEHDVGIRYSYSNSFGTGIAIQSEGGDWISDKPAELIKGGNYIIKYYVDNKIENSTNNIHVILKVDDTIISEYNTAINNYHSKQITFNTSEFDSGNYNINLFVEKINETDCNISDNIAIREIFVEGELLECGNGNLDYDEQCDQGNDNGETCEPPYNGSCQYCSETCQWIEIYDGSCGDGDLQSAYEECDDGNNADGDGCSSECEIEELLNCGNGNPDIGEQCDQGNDNGNVCEPEYNEACTYCSDNCQSIEVKGPYCGDNDTQGDYEECDNGILNGILCQAGYDEFCNYCSLICIINQVKGSYCGDNITQDNYEECDSGINNGKVCDNSKKDCTYCSNSCEIIEKEKKECKSCKDNNKDVNEIGFYCEPNWQCSAWSECIDEVMRRTCADKNYCYNEINKPAETTGCYSSISKQVLLGQENETGTPIWIWVLLALIVIAIIIILVNKM